MTLHQGRFLEHVNYATDRKFDANAKKEEQFTGERGILRYGHALISIPGSHSIGEIERPKFWRFEFSSNPDKHFVLQDTQLQSIADWTKDVRARVQKAPRKSALLFVHGYNVGFLEALYRTAQMQHDLHFEGASVLFSWPSTGTEVGYPVDEGNVIWSVPHFREVLYRVLDQSGATEIFIIAHSMGNRVLTDVLREVARSRPDARAKIKQVILAAPDIDADVFKRDIAPEIRKTAQSITLYSSDRDYALLASYKFHGYKRAGDAKRGVVIAPPIQTVDVSNGSDDFLGHSYISNSRSVLRDVRWMLKGYSSPASRGMAPVGKGARRYWKLP